MAVTYKRNYKQGRKKAKRTYTNNHPPVKLSAGSKLSWAEIMERVESIGQRNDERMGFVDVPRKVYPPESSRAYRD